MLLSEYESKIEQSKRYKGWMPETYYITEKEEAEKENRSAWGIRLFQRQVPGQRQRTSRLIQERRTGATGNRRGFRQLIRLLTDSGSATREGTFCGNGLSRTTDMITVLV